MQEQENNKRSENLDRRSLLKGGSALAGFSMMPNLVGG